MSPKVLDECDEPKLDEAELEGQKNSHHGAEGARDASNGVRARARVGRGAAAREREEREQGGRSGRG